MSQPPKSLSFFDRVKGLFSGFKTYLFGDKQAKLKGKMERGDVLIDEINEQQNSSPELSSPEPEYETLYRHESILAHMDDLHDEIKGLNRSINFRRAQGLSALIMVSGIAMGLVNIPMIGGVIGVMAAYKVMKGIGPRKKERKAYAREYDRTAAATGEAYGNSRMVDKANQGFLTRIAKLEKRHGQPGLVSRIKSAFNPGSSNKPDTPIEREQELSR